MLRPIAECRRIPMVNLTTAELQALRAEVVQEALTLERAGELRRALIKLMSIEVIDELIAMKMGVN